MHRYAPIIHSYGQVHFAPSPLTHTALTRNGHVDLGQISKTHNLYEMLFPACI